MFRLFLREKVKSAKTKKATAEKAASRKNRRAFERFDVDHKHLTMMNEQDILVVKDISAKGFSSTVSPRAYERMNIGDVYSARIRYLGELYDLQARVSWKSTDTVGFELEKAERRAIEFMQRVIQPIALGSSLQKVDTNYTKASTDGKVWYHGDGDTDFYVWHDDENNITAWQFIHSEKFLDWERLRGMRSGHLEVANESVSGVLDVTKKALKQVTHPAPDRVFVQFVVDVVMSSSSIEEKDDILGIILA